MDDKQVVQEVTGGWKWLKAHERLLIVAMLLGSSLWIGNRVINWRAAKDQQTAAVAVAQLDQQKNINAQQAAQSAALQAQYQQMLDTLAKQNATLAAAVSARNTELAKQQQQDASLTTPELVTRWQQLIPAGTLTVEPNGVTVDPVAAHATVAQLEQVPVLEQNLSDETQIADNRQKEVDSANTTISALNMQVSGLNAQSKDQEVACKAQIAQVQAESRKGKVKWFKIGFVTGFVSGLWVGHKIP